MTVTAAVEITSPRVSSSRIERFTGTTASPGARVKPSTTTVSVPSSTLSSTGANSNCAVPVRNPAAMLSANAVTGVNSPAPAVPADTVT